MKRSESIEMYLETILRLTQNNPKLHAIDVAVELDYSRASVSRAMKRLEESGCIKIERNVINLTPLGEKMAKEVYERHHAIKELLLMIGADDTLAEQDACRIEHVVSDQLMELIKNYTAK